MIDQATYDDIKGRLDEHNRERLAKYGDGPYPSENNGLPARPTNDELADLEVFEFCRDKPDRYFAYVKLSDKPNGRFVTGWTGHVLGKITWVGPVFRSGWFDVARRRPERRNLTVRGINGVRYYGTYYSGSGDYCRLYAYKDQS